MFTAKFGEAHPVSSEVYFVLLFISILASAEDTAFFGYLSIEGLSMFLPKRPNARNRSQTTERTSQLQGINHDTGIGDSAARLKREWVI